MIDFVLVIFAIALGTVIGQIVAWAIVGALTGDDDK